MTIFLLYMITLACHPGLTVLVEATGLHSGDLNLLKPNVLITPTKGSATSWEKVYFVPVNCFLCFTVGNFLGRLVGFWSVWMTALSSLNCCSGDALPSDAHPDAGPLPHLAQGARPPPLPRLQSHAPQALLHPRPYPFWCCLHRPHAGLQHLHWNSYQVRQTLVSTWFQLSVSVWWWWGWRPGWGRKSSKLQQTSWWAIS